MKSEALLVRCCGVAVLLARAVGVFAGSHEGEFTGYKVTGPGPYHVDVVSGHGKTCYVFTQMKVATPATWLWVHFRYNGMTSETLPG